MGESPRGFAVVHLDGVDGTLTGTNFRIPTGDITGRSSAGEDVEVVGSSIDVEIFDKVGHVPCTASRSAT